MIFYKSKTVEFWAIFMNIPWGGHTNQMTIYCQGKLLNKCSNSTSWATWKAFLITFICGNIPQQGYIYLPQLERIIPCALSEWNGIKGGSDTLTKLLWLNTYDPPCDTP